MNKEIERLLDILSKNDKIDVARDDNVYIYLKYRNQEPNPAFRIRKDNAMVQSLSGINFVFNGQNLGYFVSCEKFAELFLQNNP